MNIAEIKRMLDEMTMACETIRSAERCAMCPLKGSCLDDMPFTVVAYEAEAKAIERFLCMADRVTEAQEEAEKSEYDRKWEAEADYWNDRRCDPDEE